jgi:branched-chain amino acid transport system substrate-binding protein
MRLYERVQAGQQQHAAERRGGGAYDGLALIYKALEATKEASDGGSLKKAMKGMSWESPRGPITIGPVIRDIVHNIYLRKVEWVNGELYNVEFETVKDVRDPAH